MSEKPAASPSNWSSRVERALPAVVFLAVSVFLFACAIGLIRHVGSPKNFAEWGSLGDFLSGVVGTTIGTVSVLALFGTYALTRRAMVDSAQAAQLAADSAEKTATALAELGKTTKIAAERDELLRVLQLMQKHVDELSEQFVQEPGSRLMSLRMLARERTSSTTARLSNCVSIIVTYCPGIVHDIVGSIERMLDLVDPVEPPEGPEGLIRAYLRMKNFDVVHLLRDALPQGDEAHVGLHESRLNALHERLVPSILRLVLPPAAEVVQAH